MRLLVLMSEKAPNRFKTPSAVSYRTFCLTVHLLWSYGLECFNFPSWVTWTHRSQKDDFLTRIVWGSKDQKCRINYKADLVSCTVRKTADWWWWKCVQWQTGPHSDTVQWRSHGGPVQFLSLGGLVEGSHDLVSSEQRTSRVTCALRPHLARHWTKRKKRWTKRKKRLDWENALNHDYTRN